MASDITRLDLRLRRRLLIGCTLGIAAYAFSIVSMYPSFENDTSLNELTSGESALTYALFGFTGTLTSPTGWVTAQLYTNFVPLIVLLVTIGYGASCIAGQNDDRTLGLVTTLPLSRRAITVSKLAAMLVAALPVPIVTALCVLVGRGYHLTIGLGSLLGITAGVILLGLVFGTLAMLIGAVTGSRGLALGITSGVAAVAYLISSLAPVVDWIRPARYLSPFFYAVGDNQLVHGLSPAGAAVLVCATLVFAVAAAVAFDRLDVH